jgi:hypothetical protein
MSSQNSRQVPTFAEHQEALAAAVVEVGENSFFAFVTPADADLFAELARSPQSLDAEAGEPLRWINTDVTFTGAFRGVLGVAMPERLARELLAAFVGLGPDDPIEPEQLRDSTGEFANQVCGTWLTRACHRRRFDLSPPEVRHLPAAWNPDSPATPGEEGAIYFTLNDQPVKVSLRFLPFDQDAA